MPLLYFYISNHFAHTKIFSTFSTDIHIQITRKT